LIGENLGGLLFSRENGNNSGKSSAGRKSFRCPWPDCIGDGATQQVRRIEFLLTANPVGRRACTRWALVAARRSRTGGSFGSWTETPRSSENSGSCSA